jgi:hypothetical protein
MWTGRVAATLRGLAYAPDGRTLYTADAGGRVHAWDTAARTRLLLFQLDGSYGWYTRALAVVGDGRFLVVRTNHLLVCYLAGGAKRVQVPMPFARGNVQVDPAGPRLLTYNTRGTAVLTWDLARRRRGPALAQWRGAANVPQTNSFRLAPGGRTLAMMARGGRWILRRAPDWEEAGRLPDEAAWSFDVRFAPDGRTLAVRVGDEVLLCDLPSGSLRCRTRARVLAFHPTEPVYAGLEGDRVLALVSLRTGETIRSFDFALGRSVGHAAFAPDGMTCAAGGSNKSFVVFDVDF